MKQEPPNTSELLARQQDRFFHSDGMWICHDCGAEFLTGHARAEHSLNVHIQYLIREERLAELELQAAQALNDAAISFYVEIASMENRSKQLWCDAADHMEAIRETIWRPACVRWMDSHPDYFDNLSASVVIQSDSDKYRPLDSFVDGAGA